MMLKEDKNVENFKSLWLKHHEASTDKHQLFFKEHSVKKQDQELPRGRTLFVLNIPPYVTRNALKSAFARHCGIIKNVIFKSAFSSSQTGFKVAYIVFSKESSLTKALALPRDFTLVLESRKSQNPVGLLKWIKEYNEAADADEEKLQEEINKYMADYDKRVEERLKAQEQTEDADGWVTVSSKKKRGQFAPSRKESTIEKVQTKEKEKSKKKELLNFYTFQIRESKKQHLAELRKKFEMDKKKLQELKKKRTFKPFG